MTVARREDFKTYYFASYNSAIRTKQFVENKNACIYFSFNKYPSSEWSEELMLEGTMEVLNDDETKKMIWKKDMQNRYTNGGINDPDYCVLKFSFKKLRYCRLYMLPESINLGEDELWYYRGILNGCQGYGR
jgi:general stress protein 26